MGINITRHEATVVFNGQEILGALEVFCSWCTVELWGPSYQEINHGHRYIYEFNPNDRTMVDVLDGQSFTLKQVENVTTQDIKCEGINIDGDAIVLDVNDISVFGVGGIESVLDIEAG